jgi:uncharacterized metal-binding protein YceD (DUF177 family)
MKTFVISFYGLKPGKHTFEFTIDRAFFEAFESTLVEDARFNVVIELEKLSNMLILRFEGGGELDDYCDRCGDPLSMEVLVSDELFVKFGDEPYEQTDEVLVVTHDTHEIDVSQMIYEMIVLNLPGKKVHKSIEDCNQEVIKRLNEAQKRDDHDEDETDPRWEALKKLK